MVIFQIVFVVTMLVLVWRIADGQEALKLLTRANPIWLLASIAALVLQILLSAMRWQLTARELGIVLTRNTAVREYFLSQVVNQVLPGGFVGDASRALRNRSSSGFMISGQVVVIERLAGQLGLIVFMLSGVLVAVLWPPAGGVPSLLLIVVGGLLLMVILSVVILILIAELSQSGLGRALNKFGAAAKSALWSKGVRSRQLGFSLGAAGCVIAGFSFAAMAVGSRIFVLTAVVMIPMILMAMLIPLTIGGWGFREGAAVVFFPIFGLSATDGLAASVTFGLIALVVSLPGLLFVVSRKGKNPRPLEPAVSGA